MMKIQLIHSQTESQRAVELHERFQYSFVTTTDLFGSTFPWLMVGADQNPEKPYRIISNAFIYWSSLCFLFRSKPSTQNSSATWSARSSVMLRTNAAPWSCWRCPRISVLWSSWNVVSEHTSAPSESVKSWVTSWLICVRLPRTPPTPSKLDVPSAHLRPRHRMFLESWNVTEDWEKIKKKTFESLIKGKWTFLFVVCLEFQQAIASVQQFSCNEFLKIAKSLKFFDQRLLFLLQVLDSFDLQFVESKPRVHMNRCHSVARFANQMLH